MWVHASVENSGFGDTKSLKLLFLLIYFSYIYVSCPTVYVPLWVSKFFKKTIKCSKIQNYNKYTVYLKAKHKSLCHLARHG